MQEFLPKTLPTKAPGILGFNNGDNIKHPSIYTYCLLLNKFLRTASFMTISSDRRRLGRILRLYISGRGGNTT